MAEKLTEPLHFLKYNVLNQVTNKSSIYIFNTYKEKKHNTLCVPEKIKSLNVLKNFFSYNTKNNTTINIFFCSLTILKKNAFDYFYFTNQSLLLPFTKAQTIANYIAKQIKTPQRRRDLGFKTSLKTGVKLLAVDIIQNTKIFNKSSFKGLKIECSGKWRQTTAGRAQKESYLFGNLSSQSVNELIFYSSCKAATKYGTCNIKVWVCYKQMH